MTDWQTLLGLPLEKAEEQVRAAGCEPVVMETCAPRRMQAEGGTLRVIRVTEGATGPCLTVSAFLDGDPRKMES